MEWSSRGLDTRMGTRAPRNGSALPKVPGGLKPDGYAGYDASATVSAGASASRPSDFILLSSVL